MANIIIAIKILIPKIGKTNIEIKANHNNMFKNFFAQFAQVVL